MTAYTHTNTNTSAIAGIRQEPRHAFQRFHFCTDQHPQSQRIDIWKDQVINEYSKHEVSCIVGSDTRFFQRATSFAFDRIKFARFEGSPVRVVRNRGHLTDGNDDFVFRINRVGSMHVTNVTPMGGKTSGEISATHLVAVLASNGCASEADYWHQSPGLGSCYSIAIPRSMLLSAVPDADDRLLGFNRMAEPLTQALVRFFDDFLAGKLTPGLATAEEIEAHIFDLVCLILGPTRDAKALATRRGLRQARLASILGLVRHCFLHAELRASNVAWHLGTTERYVQKILEENGTTFRELLLATRLAHAAEKLAHPSMRSVPISEISEQSGFNDAAYFSRAFKQRYEQSAREYRGHMQTIAA